MGIIHHIDWDLEVFKDIRTGAGITSYLTEMGEENAADLNTELAAAQTARNQPVAEGYTSHLGDGTTRKRLQIIAYTARAQAHEAKHMSILKRIGDIRAETTKVREADAAAAAHAREVAAVERRAKREAAAAAKALRP